MSLLPSRPDAEPAADAGPRVIGLDDEAADDVLAALSSGTARSLLAALHEEPAPPSELAQRCDTSLQNVQYHLEKLENAGAVEIVETAYSEKGREMDVYAPADQPLVVFAGDEDEGSTLRTAIKRLLGAVGVLGLASLLIQATLGRFSLGFGSGMGGGDGADRAPELGDGGGGGAPSGAPTDDSAEYQGEGTDNATAGGDGGATATPAQDTPTPDATGTAPPETTETVAPDATETVAETATEAARDTATETATQVTTTEAARTGVESAAAGLPPGLVFFAGGLFVLAVVAGVWYLNQR